MKVILQRDLASVGHRGQIVDVNEAYARNYLLPNQIAVVATAAAQQKLAAQQAAVKATKQRLAADLSAAQQQLAQITIRLTGRANPQGGLFAAIKSPQVIAALEAQFKVKLPGLKIEPESFKHLGQHQVNLKWPGGETGTLTVIIEAA
jgi:large subunit ribosomal protein L9